MVTPKGTAPQVALAFLPLSQCLTSVQDLSYKSVMKYFSHPGYGYTKAKKLSYLLLVSS